MKKAVLILTLMVGLSTLLFAQNRPTPASLADIKFETMSHDFGNIKQGTSAEYSFKFTNAGKEPLVITICQASCECLVAKCPKDPILPGKSGVVAVKYDTQRIGGIYRSVTINSNAKSGTVVLTVKGNVEALPVTIAPAPAAKKVGTR